LLELICTASARPTTPTTVARALRRLYNLGVKPDWWKLEAQSAEGWQALGNVIGECDPRCNGVLLLGLDADDASLQRAFDVAARFPVCRGFAVGRSIFGASARDWLAGTVDDAEAVRRVAGAYRRVIGMWRAACSARDGAARASLHAREG